MLPKPLKVLAIVLVLSGTLSIAHTAYMQISGNTMGADIPINPAILAFFAGFGLLRLSSVWRKCIRFVLILNVVVSPFVFVVFTIGFLVSHDNMKGNFMVFPWLTTPFDRLVPFWLFVIPLWTVLFGALRVLDSPGMKEMFENCERVPGPSGLHPEYIHDRLKWILALFAVALGVLSGKL